MLKYVKGDATNPQGQGNKIIPHVCNDIGAFGAGFVLAIDRKWKVVKQEYLKWYHTDSDFMLGAVQFIQVEDDILVANMIGQHGVYKGKDGSSPVRYDAIRQALRSVAKYAVVKTATVHAPRFGAGLAGVTGMKSRKSSMKNSWKKAST